MTRAIPEKTEVMLVMGPGGFAGVRFGNFLKANKIPFVLERKLANMMLFITNRLVAVVSSKSKVVARANENVIIVHRNNC